MKKLVWAGIVCAVIFSVSGIPINADEDYDILKSEYDKLILQYEKLQSDNEKMSSKLEGVSGNHKHYSDRTCPKDQILRIHDGDCDPDYYRLYEKQGGVLNQWKEKYSDLEDEKWELYYKLETKWSETYSEIANDVDYDIKSQISRLENAFDVEADELRLLQDDYNLLKSEFDTLQRRVTLGLIGNQTNNYLEQENQILKTKLNSMNYTILQDENKLLENEIKSLNEYIFEQNKLMFKVIEIFYSEQSQE